MQQNSVTHENYIPTNQQNMDNPRTLIPPTNKNDSSEYLCWYKFVSGFWCIFKVTIQTMFLLKLYV